MSFPQILGSITFAALSAAPAASGPLPVANVAGALNANVVVSANGLTYAVRFAPPVLASVANALAPGAALPLPDATSSQFAFATELLPGKVPGLLGPAVLPVIKIYTVNTPAVADPQIEIIDPVTYGFTLPALAPGGATTWNIVATLFLLEVPNS